MKLFASTKAAQTVAAATTSTGLGTILDLIPDDIGKLASVVGICLTLVLIYGHIKKGRIERKKMALETELLQRKLDDED